MNEKTLVLLKPETIKRGIAGEIIQRFERAGIKIVGMKLVHVTRDFAKDHYLTTAEQLTRMGNNTVLDCKENNVDLVSVLGTEDPLKLGEMIWEWGINYLVSGPVVALVLEGIHVITNVRSMCGHTLPSKAAPGTIRGDYALDSAISANFAKRSIYNLIHASGNKEEAEREIKLWFKPEELVSYQRVHEQLYS